MSTVGTSQLLPHDHVLRPLVWLVPRIVRPNHLTIFRMMMTPVVIWVLVMQWFAVGVPLFFLVAASDAIDGSLARIRNQITPWGEFFDPLADKFLVGSMLVLVLVQHVNVWIVVSVLLTEALMIIGGLRKKRLGLSVTSNVWGKVKMNLQCLGILLVLIALWFGGADVLLAAEGIFVASIAASIGALLTYSL
jgi:CDP-diacylglycerol--glycerol-3-phosphate 3-phosphatidyltransferase